MRQARRRSRGCQRDRRQALIVRIRVYATPGQNFVLRMLELMRSRQELTIVADQSDLRPGRALASACGAWRARMHRYPSLGDAGVASWYDFAVAIRTGAPSCSCGPACCHSHGRISTAARRPPTACWTPLGLRRPGRPGAFSQPGQMLDRRDRAVRRAPRTLLPCTFRAGGLHAPPSATSCGGCVTSRGYGPPGKLSNIVHLLEVIKYARVVRTGCAVL
jgi:hypothetical protein